MKTISSQILSGSVYNHRLLLILLFLCFGNISLSQVTSMSDGDYSDDAVWIGSAPDESVDDVLILHDLITDGNLNISQTFEIVGSLTGTGDDITVNGSGNLIIGKLEIDKKLRLIDNATLLVKAGDTLMVEDLELEDNAAVIIESGAVVIITEDFDMRNNSSIIIEDGAIIDIGDNVKIENDATVTIGDNVSLTIAGNLEVKDNAEVVIGNDSNINIGEDLKLRGDSSFTVGTGTEIIVENDFTIQNDAELILNGHLDVGDKTHVKNNATITGTGTLATGNSTQIQDGLDIFGNTEECIGCIYSMGCSYSATVTTWDGSVSTDWFNEGNWSAGVPNNTVPAVISATAPNYPLINVAGAVCFHLSIEAGASLEISGTEGIDIWGNLDVSGTLIANNSVLNFVGDCWPSKITGTGTVALHSVTVDNIFDVAIESGAYDLFGSLDIVSGGFETNDSLTVISNEFGTGRIGEITGDGITGEIVMQRYIDEGDTYWRYFSSAVDGATFEQYNDDFTTAGYPGSHWPSFPFISVYTYDETLIGGAGYLPASSASQIIETGQGVQVWCGDTITGTDPFLVDLRGTANQGDINMPVSFTDTGVPLEDGFCHLGNPYPSTIDWDAPGWTKSNMNDVLYILDPDTQGYATYINGASANGGSRYIPSQQSFWVEANAASPALTLRESCKSTEDPIFYLGGDEPNLGCNITLSGFEMSDECVLRNQEGTLDTLEGNYDARKLWGAWGVNPQVSLINESALDLTVHTFDFEYQEWAIPLRAVVFESGMYTLNFRNIEQLDVPCIQLEDNYTGERYAIEDSVDLEFYLSDTTYASRFTLHIGKKYEQTVINNLCAGDSTGQLIIDLQTPDETTYDLISGDDTTAYDGFVNPLVVDGLQAGVYTIEVATLENLCSSNAFDFEISEPDPLSVTEAITHSDGSANGSISIVVEGGTPDYNYFWNNGATSSEIASLEAGMYSVWIVDDNGCELFVSYEITSFAELFAEEGIANVFYDAKKHQVILNNMEALNGQEILLLNANGQVIQKFNATMASENGAISLPKMSSGIYFLKTESGMETLKFSVVD